MSHAEMARPSHVPPGLVVDDFPLLLGATTTENPFDRIVPDIHRRYPEVFWVNRGFLGFGDCWYVRPAAMLRAIYADTEHFSSKDFAGFGKMIGETWNQVPAETDPPLHALYRALVNPLFTPRAVGQLDAQVRQTALRYIAAFKDRGSCDFVAEFATPFPVSVFLFLMGLPEEEMPQLLAWEHQLLHVPDQAVVADGVRSVTTYLRRAIAERRRQPREDLISFGIAAEVDGRRLTEDELIGFCFGLYIAGLDTVTANMGLHFRHLAENPDDQRRLRTDRSLIPAAVEELMRAYPAVTTFRTVAAPVRVGGVDFAVGDKVAMSTTLAGTDPVEFEESRAIRLNRRANHLSFAYGPHRCLGVNLARRELSLAMEAMFDALPEFRIEPGATLTTELGGIIHLPRLPLSWQAT